MPARKIRVELFDGDGNRYTVAFEGQVTRDKAVRLLDLVELLGGVSGNPTSTATNGGVANSGLSKYDKVRMVVHKSFPLVWFSSKEVQSVFEQENKEPISLSTVATYLARLASRGLLMREGTSNRLKYRITSGFPEAVAKQRMP